MDLLNVITECLKESKGEPSTEIGRKLYLLAKDLQEQTENEEELVKKIKDLKKAEAENDLAWIDLRSWYILSPIFQKFFTDSIDPLNYGGIYFRLSEFSKKLEDFIPYLEGYQRLALVKDANTHLIVALSGTKGTPRKYVISPNILKVYEYDGKVIERNLHEDSTA